MITQLCEAEANDSVNKCGSTVSILNDSKVYDAFDKQNGGGQNRPRFRLKRHESCEFNRCKLEIIAGTAPAENIIAVIDLAGRTVSSYCLYEMRRINVPWHRYHLGCPSSYSLNVLGINLVDKDGPFSERRVDIKYMYNAHGGSVSLDRCISPGIAEGILRRHVWTVPPRDGSEALIFIGETDSPRNAHQVLSRDILELPYATSVFGAESQ